MFRSSYPVFEIHCKITVIFGGIYSYPVSNIQTKLFPNLVSDLFTVEYNVLINSISIINHLR